MAAPRKMALSADELRELFAIDPKLTTQKAAAALGVSRSCVCNWLDKYRISVYRGEGKNWKYRKFGAIKKFTLSTDDLRRIYHTEGKTQKEIAAMVGVSRACVTRWIRRSSLRLGPSELAERAREHNCKGRRRKWGSGYIYVRDMAHPRAYRGYIEEHVAIVEGHLKRYLLNGEEVHHINLKKDDNRIENLALLSKIQHGIVHKYYERVGVYLLGLNSETPSPVAFESEVLWGGQMVTSIDLIRTT